MSKTHSENPKEEATTQAQAEQVKLKKTLNHMVMMNLRIWNIEMQNQSTDLKI